MSVPPGLDAPPVSPGAAPVFSVPDAQAGSLPVTVSPPSVWLTERLVRWLRYHFGAASRIEFDALKGRVWTADPSSPIVITSLAEWNPAMSQNRPAVLVDRLAQRRDMAHRVIGDRLQGGTPGYHVNFMEGMHVVHHIGGQDGEAELLAHEVWRELDRFGPAARNAYCLLRFLPMEIGKRTQLSDDFKTTYTVPIPILYNYNQFWKITPIDEEKINIIKTTFQFPAVP